MQGHNNIARFIYLCNTAIKSNGNLLKITLVLLHFLNDTNNIE